MTSVSIPNGFEEIATDAFKGCSSLASFEVDENNERFRSIDGVLFSRDGQTLIKAPTKLEGSYVVPAGVVRICDGAFCNCSELKTILVQKGVKTIGAMTFANCSSLKSVVIPKGVDKIGTAAFLGCGSLTSFVVPPGVREIGGLAFMGCVSLKTISIPESVKVIGLGAFKLCPFLTISVPKDSLAERDGVNLAASASSSDSGSDSDSDSDWRSIWWLIGLIVIIAKIFIRLASSSN